jgi:hypothetical protein
MFGALRTQTAIYPVMATSYLLPKTASLLYDDCDSLNAPEHSGFVSFAVLFVWHMLTILYAARLCLYRSVIRYGAYYSGEKDG